MADAPPTQNPTPVTPPATTPPPAAATPPPEDPWMANILGDMGKILKEGKVEEAPPKAPDPDRNVLDGQFVSIGEHARFKKERKEQEDAAAKAKETTPPAPEKKDSEPKTETPPAPADKKEEKPPAKPKIEVEKAKPLEEIVEGVVRRVTQDKVQPTPPPVTAPEKKTEDPDAAYVEALDEDQKEAVELARFASTAMPDKYGNMPKRMIDYLKKVDTYIEGKRKEDPEWNPESDEGFAAFIEENQPTYESGDRKKLERQQIVQEARAEIKKEFQPKLDESERIARVQELKPEIDKATESYRATVAQRLARDDKSPFTEIVKVAGEKGFTEEGWKAAAEIDPLAATYAKSYLGQASTLGREYLELVSGVGQQVPFKPELPLNHVHNQKHLTQMKLFGFIENQERVFAEKGGDMRVVNGKSFVSRKEFASMPAAEQARHWTLGHQDVLDMLAMAAAQQAQSDLKAEQTRREEQGYVRNGKHKTPKKEEAPPPAQTKREESPKATTTPAPGAANPHPPSSAPTLFTEDQLKKQWEGGPAMSRW